MNQSKLTVDDMIIVGGGYCGRLVRVGSISTIEVSGNEITVRVNGWEPIVMQSSLVHCRKRFPDNFFCAGRHYLVNLAEVFKVNMATKTFVITMNDGTMVTVSRQQSRAFRKELGL